MPSSLLAPMVVEFWLHRLAFYEAQRALLLQLQLDFLAAALSIEQPNDPDKSNVIPFRRPLKQVVVVKLR